jgi:ribosomal protein S8E
MHSQPAKTDCIGDNGENDQDIRPPGAEICETSKDKKKSNLNSERDAIAEENNTVDRTKFAGEDKRSRIACCLIEEVLESRRSEI